MKEAQTLEEMVDFAIYRLALVANHLRRSSFPLTTEQQARLEDLAEQVYNRAGEMANVCGRSDLK